jgi:hypothetical protein
MFVCAETGCHYLEIATLPECEKARCCFTFQRSREEAAIDQARKDEKERMRDHA